MALDTRAKGTGTISPTQVVTSVTSTKKDLPYVDVSSSDTRAFISASSQVVMSPRASVHDLLGTVGIHWTILNNTTARVYADRSFPAGKELVFDWISIQD